MTLGQLAGHIANILHWCDAVLTHTVFDVATAEDMRSMQLVSVAELPAEFDKEVKAAREGRAWRRSSFS